MVRLLPPFFLAPSLNSTISSMVSSPLSETLNAKLRKCCNSLPRSLTCLRLDTESCRIGVWQRRAGHRRVTDSNWVMMVKLEKKNDDEFQATESPEKGMEEVKLSSTEDSLDDEEKAALQMIEELLNKI